MHEPYRQLNVPDPLAVGVDATGLTWLSPLNKISALFGLFSTMLVQLLGQTRIFMVMSRDGLLPPLFGNNRGNERRRDCTTQERDRDRPDHDDHEPGGGNRGQGRPNTQETRESQAECAEHFAHANEPQE
jgi:hypothetical protein